MLPYQVLMQDKGLSKAELPASVKNDIKALERVLRGVSSFGKTDENGDYIISQSTQDKITVRDNKIMESIYDYLEQKQSKEMAKELEDNEQKKQGGTVDPVSKTDTDDHSTISSTGVSTSTDNSPENKEEGNKVTEKDKAKSSGSIIGFFDF
jgi:hypothetical protein